MRPLTLAAALLALAGCAHDQNMTVSTVHQPVVSTRDWTLALAGDGFGLQPGEPQRLAGWLAGLELAPGDRVATDAPPGPARDAVARVLGEQGMLLSGDRPAGEPAASGWRVVLSRSTAAVPGCPDWSQAQLPKSAPAASRNYGCAIGQNLATMLADPMDLVRGRGTNGALDPRVTVKAIGSWRDAKPTGTGGLKGDTATGGAK